MKKLRRFTFDEMRQNMVCIEEDAQREYVGGKYYYKPDGTFLYSDGSGNDVMIMDMAIGSGYTPSGLRQTWLPTTHISQATLTEKSNVINTMAKSIGINSVQVYDFGDVTKYGRTTNAGISVNSASTNIYNGNFFDIMCNLVHEKNHADSRQNAGTAQSEVDAILATVSSSYWKDSSSTYKNGAAGAYKEAMGLTNMSLAEVLKEMEKAANMGCH